MSLSASVWAMCVCMRAYVRAYVRACVCMCVYVCARARVRACVCVSARECDTFCKYLVQTRFRCGTRPITVLWPIDF